MDLVVMISVIVLQLRIFLLRKFIVGEEGDYFVGWRKSFIYFVGKKKSLRVRILCY